MKTFTIRRRNAWNNAEELGATAAVSKRIGDDEMPDRVRWIRSYVVNESDGTLGTLCVYQATDAETIRDHAQRVGMPATEINEVVDTVVVREDPAAVAQSA